MEHITNGKIEQNCPTAVTLGNFDGVHMGHRKLIETAKEYAEKENLKSVVFTFKPHPMFIFGNRENNALIMSPDEKKIAVEKMGVDTYIEYPFDREFASMSPEDFAIKIVFEKLKCKVLVVGYDYRFGKMNKGDYKLLESLGKQYGVKTVFIPNVIYEGERVSSTRIRDRLVNKDVDGANRMLTQPYYIYGHVAEGKKLGRQLGFPTVNILAHEDKLFPPNGVYATATVYEGKLYYGMTNVGYNPTVNGKRKTVETNLFDFDKVIYGEPILTFFFKWLRDENKFESVEALRQQLTRDIVNAKEYFLSEEYKYWKENVESEYKTVEK
jgi:riboflavin biosynthesis protein ribF